MDFKSIRDIKDFLNQNGCFYTKNGAVLKPAIKTGDKLSDIKELLPVEELQLREIILNNIVNPLILKENVNLKQLVVSIDYRLINDYQKKEKELNKLQNLNKQLKNCKYIYIKDTGKYYKIQNSKVRKSGIFTISKELIPEKENIKAFDNYNTVMKAYHYKKATNKFKEAYEQEVNKFNMLGVCEWYG